MKSLLTSIFLIAFSYSLSAQTYEQNKIDSLLRIVNNPDVKDADRIDPLARLSVAYLLWKDDSINSVKFIERAYALARKEKDSKYMILVHNRELSDCVNNNPKKITAAYQIIDSIYKAIARTGDRESQMLGYSSIGDAKARIDKEYDFEDLYKALSIAETLPENSAGKYRVMSNIYEILYLKNEHKNKENSEKYMHLLLQAAEKTGDKEYICAAIAKKLTFTLIYLPNDTNTISMNFAELDRFISQNINHISLYSYGGAIQNLVYTNMTYPDTQQKQLIDRHIENFRKIVGDRMYCQAILNRIESIYAFAQEDYAKAIEYYRRIVKLDERETWGDLWMDYNNMAEAYEMMKQYKQAFETLDLSFDAYQQYLNIQSEEQRQVSEIKFGVAKQQLQLQQQRSKMIFITITAIILIITVLLVMSRQNKINKLEKEKANRMAQQALAEKERLGERLITNVTELARKDQLLDKVKDMDSKQLDRAIRREQKTAKVTKDYVNLFHEIRPEFYDRLAQLAAPNKLSTTHLKYCAYISLRMSNKDLANVLNVDYKTVVSQKYNLKKIFHLTPEESLDEFIVKFAPTSINI